MQVRALSDFMAMMDLMCLKKGCLQDRLCMFLARGELTKDYISVKTCHGRCAFCLDSKLKDSFGYQYRPLWKDGVISFLENEGRLVSCQGIYNNVYKNDHWTKEIFDLKVSTVAKFHVEAMFLQLIAAGILGTEVRDGRLFWSVIRQNVKGHYPPHNWKLDDSWIGVWLYNDSDKRKYNV